MKNDINVLAKQIFEECKADGEEVTMEEALEMAEMEVKAKGIKNYAQCDIKEKKERKPKERKVDTEKATILDFIKKGLTLMLDSTTIEVENEAKLHFNYNGTEYTVNLVKHRPPKK